MIYAFTYLASKLCLRGPKGLNFPDGNFQRVKTSQTKCVNHFRDKKTRKLFSRQKKYAEILFVKKST